MELDPQFTIGDSVFLFKDYPAKIYMTNGSAEDGEVSGDSVEFFEVVSYDWNSDTQAFEYNLRLDGVLVDYDYLRVWNVNENDLTLV